MSDAYTILNSVIPNGDVREYVTALAIGGVLCVARYAATSGLRKLDLKNLEDPRQLAPTKGVSLFTVFDFFIEHFINYQDSILGSHNRKYLPFTGAIFLFIFVANLVGIIPGMPASTTLVWVNVAMALVVFVYFNYLGVRTHGFGKYLKHFCGPMDGAIGLAVAPLLFVLEGLLSNCLRILTLNLRLYWNISADHMVLESFTNLAPYIVPAIFYGLGTFVCFMQAFIFTTLTMVYILLATQHEEHAEEGHH